MATLKDLQDKADLIYNATEEGENTAERVGGAFQDAAALIGEIQSSDKSQTANISNLLGTVATQTSDISSLKDSYNYLNSTAAKMVVLTQDEYDTLVSTGKVQADVYYNVLEE